MTATATRSKKTKSKKPKWSVISFKKIEEWRTKLDLPKSGMAEALGVTNSTYHNWQRGTTVPHASQQEEILQRINALEKSAGKSGASSSGSSQGSSKGKRGKKGGGGRQGGGRSGSGGKSKPAPTSGKFSRKSMKQTSRQDTVPPGTRPGMDSVPREDVATITAAWIQSQKKGVTQAAVLKFVTALREVM